jgi:hypothetical protein
VADKGYHSNAAVLGLDKLEVRSYIAEPDRGPRNWLGKAAGSVQQQSRRNSTRSTPPARPWLGRLRAPPATGLRFQKRHNVPELVSHRGSLDSAERTADV